MRLISTDVALAKVLELARTSADHAHIESDVSEEYLRAFLRQEYAYSMQKVVRGLLSIEKAYRKLQQIEELMDKDAFKSALTKEGFGSLSGRTVDGNAVLWMDLRKCLEGTAAYVENSAESLAWLRGLIVSLKKLLDAMDPLHTADHVFWIGEKEAQMAPLVLRSCRKLFRRRLPYWTQLGDLEDVMEIVADPSAIPHWWFPPNDQISSPFGTDPSSSTTAGILDFRRCLSPGDPLLMRDILNAPQPANLAPQSAAVSGTEPWEQRPEKNVPLFSQKQSTDSNVSSLFHDRGCNGGPSRGRIFSQKQSTDSNASSLFDDRGCDGPSSLGTFSRKRSISMPDWDGEFAQPVARSTSDTVGSRRISGPRLSRSRMGNDPEPLSGSFARAVSSKRRNATHKLSGKPTAIPARLSSSSLDPYTD